MTKQIYAATITTAILALTLAASQFDARRGPDSLALPLTSIPSEVDGWKLDHANTLADDVLKELKATSYVSRTYRRDPFDLDLFVAFYAVQAAGESLHSARNCLPGSGWEIVNVQQVDLPSTGQPVRVNEYRIQRHRDRAIALYWYQTRDRIVANEYAAKAYLFWDALTRGRKSASAVRVVVRDTPEGASAAEVFASEILPEVQRTLGR